MDDICYEDVRLEGTMCVNMGFFSGGMDCKYVIPIKNRSGVSLENVNIYYDESGLNFTYSNTCGVEPSDAGGCTQSSDIEIGDFSFLDQATHFWFNSSFNSDDDLSIWVKKTFNMQELNLNKLYVTYEKNGEKYKGRLYHCPVYGYFDADDAGDNIHSDTNITTKIVNKDINLTLLYTYIPPQNSNVYVKYNLIDLNSEKYLSNWRDFYISQKEKDDIFNISDAYKEVKVVFKVCSKKLGDGSYDIKAYDECINECSDSDDEYCWRYFYSKDAFAIRPYAFRVFSTPLYKRAAEEFNISVKAVDEGNYTLNSGSIDNVVGIKGYNVNLNTINIDPISYIPSDSNITKMNEDVYGESTNNKDRVANCPYEDIFEVVNNDNFKDGDVNITLKYPETGILEINVSEIKGKEFAIVDADDTPDKDRLIKPAINIYNKNDISKNTYLLLIPYKFKTIAEYNTTTSTNWLYISNVNEQNARKNMSAFIKYTIIAYNKDGEITKNFTRTCFPDVNYPIENDIKLNTTFDLNQTATLKSSKAIDVNFYTEDINTSAIYTPIKQYKIQTTNTPINEWVGALNFKDGKAQVILYLNVNKKYNQPTLPITIRALDANTTINWAKNPGAPKIFDGDNLSNEVEFRYARVRVCNISGFNNPIDTEFRYQYWTSNGWVDNIEHNQTFGTVEQVLVNDVNFTTVAFHNGIENIKIKTSHSLPFSVKAHLKIPSWLWYHPLAKDYKDPSASNLDCLTHPCMKVEFLNSSSGWGGIKSVAAKEFSENNKTTKIKSDINTSKRHLRKINW
jgi:hypothetical protein